jgi:hypothetical protein
MRGHGGARHSGGRGALAWRIARHVLGGLLLGAGVGYVAALVLPRRYPVPPGGYQAPVPSSVPQRPAASIWRSEHPASTGDG